MVSKRIHVTGSRAVKFGCFQFNKHGCPILDCIYRLGECNDRPRTGHLVKLGVTELDSCAIPSDYIEFTTYKHGISSK